MTQNEKNKAAFRILVTITTPKLAKKAEKLLASSEVPVHYVIRGMGTAPSEMLDILGVGTPDKSIIITVLPKSFADNTMRKMYRELRFGTPGSGIAFTIPIGASTIHLVRMIENFDCEENKSPERKEKSAMKDVKHVMIAAVVNHGFSEEVMEAARNAGAGGGTVIHGRNAGNKNILTAWGIGAQEEREVVLIIAGVDEKTNIMQEISSKCGVNSDAKGLIVSFPIDGVIGLGEV